MERKRTVEHRSEYHKEKSINKRRELKVVILGSLAVFLLIFIFVQLGTDDTGEWTSAAPGTTLQEASELSKERSIAILLRDGVSPEEANAIVIAYLKLHTGKRPSMAMPSPLPNNQGDYWTMDLYYLVDEEDSENVGRRC